MKHFSTILSHEIRMLLMSSSTYIAAMLFLLVMGLIFTGILDGYSKTAQEMSPATVFFQLFWLPVLFMVPLLTMKSISDERRQGTLETLLTTPISTTEIVLGKYAACYLLYLGLWAATSGFFYFLLRFSHDSRLIDYGPLIGGYVFIGVSGLLFIAIGILASCMSRNQAVAGIICFTLLLGLIIGGRWLSTTQALNAETLKPVRAAVDYIQIFQHLDDFSRGILDSREILFYISGATLTLILSIFGLEAKLIHG